MVAREVKIEVYLYAWLRQAAPGVRPREPLVLELPEGTTLGELIGRLNIPREVTRLLYVNGVQRDEEYWLGEGDRVAIFPPIAGG